MLTEIQEVLKIYNDVVTTSLHDTRVCLPSLDRTMAQALIIAANSRLQWLRSQAAGHLDDHTIFAQNARRQAMCLEDAVLALEAAML